MPGNHTAAQIICIQLAILLDEETGLCGTGATAADKHDAFAVINLMQFIRQLHEWDMQGIRNLAVCYFIVLANIDDLEIFSPFL